MAIFGGCLSALSMSLIRRRILLIKKLLRPSKKGFTKEFLDDEIVGSSVFHSHFEALNGNVQSSQRLSDFLGVLLVSDTI